MKCLLLPKPEVSQVLINSHKLKYDVTRNSSLIYYIISFLRHNKLLFIHSITTTYNLINIVKKVSNFFSQFFEILPKF